MDSTRNLPSFTEMYQAARQRNNLGSVINAGVEGYDTQKKLNLASEETASKSKHLEAQNEYYKAEGHQKEAAAEKLKKETDVIGKGTLPIDVMVQAGLIDAGTAATAKAMGVTEMPIAPTVAIKGATTAKEKADAEKSLGDALNHIRQQAADTEAKRVKQEKDIADQANQTKSDSALILSKPSKPTVYDSAAGQAVRKGFGVGPDQTPYERDQAARAASQKRMLGSSLNVGQGTAPMAQPAANPSMPVAAPAPAAVPQPGGDENLPDYGSVEEAEQNGHKRGDRVKINGQPGTLN